MAGVLAALMSSLDTAINSMGSVTVSDFVRRYWWRNAPEDCLAWIANLLTVFFGAVVAAFSLWQLELQTETGLKKFES